MGETSNLTRPLDENAGVGSDHRRGSHLIVGGRRLGVKPLSLHGVEQRPFYSQWTSDESNAIILWICLEVPDDPAFLSPAVTQDETKEFKPQHHLSGAHSARMDEKLLPGLPSENLISQPVILVDNWDRRVREYVWMQQETGRVFHRRVFFQCNRLD